MSEIVFEAIYPTSIAAVWRALTDPEEIRAWLMETDFAPVLGHGFTFRTDPRPGFDGTVRCRVLEIEPERRLSYSWVAGGIDTVVTWTLEPRGESTAVKLVHSGFAGIQGEIVRTILASGWKGKILRDLGARAAALARAS